MGQTDTPSVGREPVSSPVAASEETIMADGSIEYHDPGCTLVRGAPFAPIVTDGRYAFVAGVVAADISGSEAVLGDIAAETELVMNAVRDMLADIGLGLDRVVKVEAHLADLNEFPAFNDAYRRFFEEGRYPARTTTESRRLYGGSRVEITCMAAL